jgi:hypothetical protein
MIHPGPLDLNIEANITMANRQITQLRQDTETPLTTLKTPFGSVLYLYARSGDSVSAGTVGQDYVAFRYNKDNLTFAVCDGVGQSFMGDLAARVLGDGLVDWLWDIKRPMTAEEFSETAADALNGLTESSAKQVADFKLPTHLPPIVKQALEMQRQYGSESMFVAGRIHLDDSEPWVAICWLGDSPVAAIDIDGKLVDLGPKGHTSERWNATTGIKGTVHTWVGSAKQVARVAGYTDGLGINGVPVDADLVRLMKAWKSDPPGDDASLFDVRLAPSPATTGEVEVPARPIEIPGQVKDSGEPTKPIVVKAEERSPVAGVEPIKAESKDDSAVDSWQPLTKQSGKPAGLPEPDTTDVSELTAKQIEMWQQAALLGLTSAALAMLMMERLLEQQRADDAGDSS